MFSEEATHRFGYHPVLSPAQQAIYEKNRALYMALFDYMTTVGTVSRELERSFDALQESLMWLNAHVACNEVES